MMIYECITRRRRVIHSMIYQACGLDKKEVTFGRQKLLLFCERAIKSSLSRGKNDQKYAKIDIITENNVYIPVPLLIL